MKKSDYKFMSDLSEIMKSDKVSKEDKIFLFETIILHSNISVREKFELYWKLTKQFSKSGSYSFRSINLRDLAAKEVKSDDKMNPEYYPYIPYGVHDFIKIISVIKKALRVKTFLDVGCGVGDKVFIAEKLHLKATGIEYYKPYQIVALNARLNAIHIDALKFEQYDQYDLIYMYRPISYTKLYLDMVEYIMEKMKIGGIFLEVYPLDYLHDLFDNSGKFKIMKFSELSPVYTRQDNMNTFLAKKIK